jgi:DNA-binding response OmpR family regulator
MNEDTGRKSILVVEDERPLLEAVRLKLEKGGFDVVTARTVEQARGYLEDVPGISAVWLDHYLLGKESGLDFVIACKADGSKHNSLPIFLVSNTASAEKVQTYMKLGINKYYVKAEMRLDGIIDDIRAELGIAKPEAQ